MALNEKLIKFMISTIVSLVLETDDEIDPHLLPTSNGERELQL